jgi:hypothetical protein
MKRHEVEVGVQSVVLDTSTGYRTMSSENTELYYFLQSEGCISTESRSSKHGTRLGLSPMPFVELALYNRTPLLADQTVIVHGKGRPPREYRNKLIIGPVPPEHTHSELTEQEIKQWKTSARGLLSRMMYGVHLARRLRCRCCVDEADLPIIQYVFKQSTELSLSSASSSAGASYTRLLQQWRRETRSP